jgi:hypothetical protein
MQHEGPQLEPLLRHLAECPPEFVQVGRIDVVAIVCDLLRRIDPTRAPELERKSIDALQSCGQPQQALISVTAWLLSHECFLTPPQLASQIWKLLLSDHLQRLARLQEGEQFVSDPDRREELVRACLSHLGFRPRGETTKQAADRLMTLDSAERDRVLRATAAAERRAREVREAMARQKALESASRYGE